MSEHKLRVLSIAHTAVSRATGRLRYHPLADHADLDVHLVAPRHWDEFGRHSVCDPQDDPGITLHPMSVVFTRLPAVKWYLHFYPGLARLARKLRPDVIHLWEEPWSAVAMQAALFRGNAALVLEVDQNILKRLPFPFEAMRRHVLRQTSLILSRSRQAEEVVRACGYTGPVRTIGYGVDTEVFYPARDNLAKDPSRPLRIGYAGRIIEEKGLDDVLDALACANHKAQLAILGEGPYLGQLKQRVQALGLEDRVSFRGWGGPEDVAQFYRNADCSILMTRTTGDVKEQFGRAIIESQGCGVPVIGSTCGAIPEVTGKGGWIINERDHAALARLIDHLAGHREELKERGKAGLANVSRRFTYETVANDLASAWREATLMNRQPARLAVT